MKKIYSLIACGLLGLSCFAQQTAIVAHRGFWNCEEGGYSENSIASLKAAQKHGFRGSEFDVHLTRDGVLIVNHNHDIDGLVIAENDWKTLKTHLLPNNERRPTLEEYLRQGKKHNTLLVMEFKKQPTPEIEDQMVNQSIALLKKHKLMDPSRVMFISFSKFICEKIAIEYPEYTNQYLNGDLSPEEVKALGINGIDYSKKVLKANPDYIARAHAAGLSTNVWTVNKEKEAKMFIAQGVQTITTNEPLMIRGLLGDNEKK